MKNLVMLAAMAVLSVSCAHGTKKSCCAKDKAKCATKESCAVKSNADGTKKKADCAGEKCAVNKATK